MRISHAPTIILAAALACDAPEPTPSTPRNVGVPVGETASQATRLGAAAKPIAECDGDAAPAPAAISLNVTAPTGADGRQPYVITIKGSVYEATLQCAIKAIEGMP